MTRIQQHEIVLAAPVDDVWRALADPEELTRWFVVEARVDGREGGEYWISWGDGMAGSSRIEAWEPGRRLRVAAEPAEGEPPGDGPIVSEWLLETRGGSTVLRLVATGIPDGSDWDGWYESTELGWTLFLRNLRHYLEHHVGRPRRQRQQAEWSVSAPSETVWQALTGADGLGFDDAPPDDGGRYAVTTRDGDRLEGEVVTHRPGRALQLTLEPLDDGLLTLSVEPSGTVWVTVATFGDGESAAADRLAARLRDVLTSLA